MKTTLFRLLAVFSFLTGAAIAETKPFVPASGLQIGLSTGGYKFFVGDQETVPATTAVTRALNKQAAKLGGILPANESFAAGVVLANSSRSDVDFTFPDAGSAAVKFKFTVTDSAGALVWESDSDLVSGQVITPATLGKGKRWARVLQIPLRVNGVALKSGLYTLEARLAADPGYAAKVGFAVASSIEVTGGDTGISGHVLKEVAPTPTSRFAPQPVKAQISIREIRLPNARYDHPEFSYDGSTDDLGAFKVVTPAGRFTVTATQLIYPAPTPPGTAHPDFIILGGTKQVEVSVNAGAFTDTTITLESPIAETGITGTVVQRTIVGQTNAIPPSFIYGETPVANANVTITEVQDPNVIYIRGPWVFTTTTDSLGAFKQLTPAGPYRVTATAPSGTIKTAALALTLSPGVDVTVATGKLSTVKVVIGSTSVR